MEKAKFVYVTYINTTAEKLWAALLDPEMTKQYWGRHCHDSDWQPGSDWTHRSYDDAKSVRVVGKVLESVPPRRLVLTWSLPEDADKPEKISRVTFEIEPFMESMRLTVTHDEIEPDSERTRAVSQGWPAILSSLKTLLETGQPLSMTTKPWGPRK
jgi:uncharacterized protein YndB with AHSA1/START domain